ncbi:MAG: phage tail tape measure protein [Lachnospiraceae bacterium]|nr:phage tail tape measure protein [Lachnospiraceae bacterium]
MAASRIKGITVEINGDTTGLNKALESVNKNIKSTQSQLKDVEKLLKLDPGNTELLAQKQKLLADAVSETKEKLATLKTAAEQANTALANGEISQEQYDALQREIVETEQKLMALEEQAEQSATAVQKIAASGEKMKTLGDDISSVGTKLLPVTAGVVALGTAAVTTAANFEDAMSSVKALLSSTSTDLEGDMEKLETAAREAGETTKFSATEAAEAMSYMGLAGWNADQMCEGLSGILNLAAASEMDLASASDIVTDYLTAFGLAASDSEMLVDKMAYAMSNSNTTTAQLGEAYKNCAATATQLGYDLDDTTAALMVMADGGIKGGEAGTALSSIMTRLGTNTSGCRDTLAEYGVTVYDAEGNVQSLSSILSSMQGVWSTLTDEEKANLAYVVAGKTAQSELMTVLGESTGSFDAYREGLAGCSGTAEEMAEIMQDNLAGQLTILKSQLQELGISFGQMLLPVIKSVVGVIQNLVDWLNGMDEGMRTVILTIALVAAAIGPVLIVVGKVISSVGTIMTLVPKLVSAFNAVKTAFSALSAVMMANPIALVIAAIAALVAAFIYLWNTNCQAKS